MSTLAANLRTHIYESDISLWCRIIPVAFEVARRHKLPLSTVLPDSMGDIGDGRKQACTGHCYPLAGSIHIVMRFRHPKTGEWMGVRPEADIWQTLAHELTHLEVGPHNARFSALMASILHDVTTARFGTHEEGK